MTKTILIALPLVILNACAPDETVSGYAAQDTTYHLVEIDGTTVGPATLTFPQEGRISGRAACNSYFAVQTLPYPWFNVEAIGATRMACSDLAAEVAFFEALRTMTLAEVTDTVLILSTEDGRQMVFEAR